MGPKRYIYDSEIARLILGYFHETDANIFEEFLRQSPFLADIRKAHANGEELNLNYIQKTLEQILQDYAHMHHIFQYSINKMLSSKLASENIDILELMLATRLEYLLKHHILPSNNSNTKSTSAAQTRHVACQTNAKDKAILQETISGIDKTKSYVTTGTQTEDCKTFHSISVQTNSIALTSNYPFQSQCNIRSEITTISSNTATCLQENSVTSQCIPRSYSPMQTDFVDNNSSQSSQQSPEWIDPIDSPAVTAPIEKPKLLRSQSCSDLPEALPSADIIEARSRIFTPRKHTLGSYPQLIFKPRIPEMINNQTLVEKLAKSINDARTEVTETEDWRVVQSIIEKTMADPSFSEIANETLEAFDMQEFLRPKSQSECTHSHPEIFSDNTTSTFSSTTLAYPSTSSVVAGGGECDVTQPPPANIYIADVNESGNVVFYSNPKCPNPAVFLPPPPPHAPPSGRYRRIQPKVDPPTGVNVVVCTPVMVEPSQPPPPASLQTKKRRTGRATPGCNTRAKRAVRQQGRLDVQQQAPPTPVLIPATPGRVYTDDMPFLSTPEPSRVALKSPPASPAPPTSISHQPTQETIPNANTSVTVSTQVKSVQQNDTLSLPEVTPYQGPTLRQRKTQSTPRRKSYIRTLDFETPQKEADTKKCVTLPKTDTTQVGATPKESLLPEAVPCSTKKFKDKKDTLRNKKLVLDGKKEKIDPIGGKPPRSAAKKMSSCARSKGKLPNASIKENLVVAADETPIATRSPNDTHLSGFWNPFNTVIGDLQIVANRPEAPDPDTTEQPETTEKITKQQTWDSLLRNSIGETERQVSNLTKQFNRRKRIIRNISPKASTSKPARTSKKSQFTRSKASKMSPSKKHAKSTTKRRTYAISHGSSSAFETSSSDEDIAVCVKKADLSEITPAKVEGPVVPEDTPFTKLLKENIDSVDIELSMITTPIFPPTPSIHVFHEQVTPLHETRKTDYSSGSSYYKPDLSSPVSVAGLATVAEMERSEECLQDVSTVSGRNLVLTPEEKESSPGKRSKITDYFRPTISEIPKSYVSPGSMQVTVNSSELRSDDSCVTIEQSTIVQLQKEKTLNQSDHKSYADPNKSIDMPEEDKTADLAEKSRDVSDQEITAECPEIGPLSVKSLACATLKNIASNSKSVKSNGTLNDSQENNNGPQCNDKINDIVHQGLRISARRKLPGKHMGLLKLDTIAKCDIKLSENIPISAPIDPGQTDISITSGVDSSVLDSSHPANNTSSQSFANERTNPNAVPAFLSLIPNKSHPKAVASVREELERKRQETIRKINDTKGLKRTLKPLERSLKKKCGMMPPNLMSINDYRSSRDTSETNPQKKVEVLSAPLISSTPNKSDSRLSVTVSDESIQPESPIIHHPAKTNTNSAPQVAENSGSSQGKGQFPPFVDDGEFPELPLTSKRKLFVVKVITRLPEVEAYLANYGKTKENVTLEPHYLSLFRVMFKWLRNPPEKSRFSTQTAKRIDDLYSMYQKINEGLPAKRDRSHNSKDRSGSKDSNTSFKKTKTGDKSPARSKVHTSLPPKKRKNAEHTAKSKEEGKCRADVVLAADGAPCSSTADRRGVLQLQDIDLDKFLSRVHGHDSS